MTKNKCKIIAIISQKGGVGKTTIAWNVLVAFISAGIKAVLIDCDNNQYSSFETMLGREDHNILPAVEVLAMTAKEVQEDIINLSKKYDVILIECGGRIEINKDTREVKDEETETAMALADLIVMPLKAGSLEVKTIKNVERLLEKADCTKTKSIIIPNLVSNCPMNNDLKELLEIEPKYFKYSKAFLSNRQAFSTPFKSGQAVFEMKPKNRLAVLEFNKVFDEVFDA